MKPAALSYLRVSSQGQISGDGFDRQRAAVDRFARTAGYQLAGEYRDEGVSGTKELSNRPGLVAMLERIETDRLTVVIIERADRLARDLMVSEVLLGQLAKAGATVLTADGANLSTAPDDPTRTLIRQVLAAVAQFDKTVTVLKLRAARERRRLKGFRVEGRKPYGFRPLERAVLEQMRALRRQRARGRRLSCATIASRLNQTGHRTRYGKPWTRGAVHVLLSRRLEP
jgi:DNA invertase Pin-like site-specific DNA recombinase